MATKKQNIFSAFDISHEEVKNGFSMPYTHYHKDYEIYLLRTGRRIVTIDDAEYETIGGEASLFASMAPHTSRGRGDFSGTCIHFSPDYLKSSFSTTATRQLLQCFNRKILRLNETEWKQIDAVIEMFDPESEYKYLQLGQLLEILCAAAKRTSKEALLPLTNPRENKASEILAYVENNYFYITNISDLATQFNVSEGYIYYVFQRYHNTTPKKYINDLKFKTFEHRLRYTNHTLRAIAEECGFSCYEYFCRLFKTRYGCTPGQYRRTLAK